MMNVFLQMKENPKNRRFCSIKNFKNGFKLKINNKKILFIKVNKTLNK